VENDMNGHRTLRGAVEIMGRGLHTNLRLRLQLRPAPLGVGVAFVRDDLGVAIAATVANVHSVDHATVIGRDTAQVRTVEHVLAALYAFGITNVFVGVDGPEVPIADGSARQFVELIAGIGILEQGGAVPSLKVTRPVRVSDGEGWIELRPSDGLLIDCSIRFVEKAIGSQRFAARIDADTFASAIAPSRTFGFLKERVELREHGLAMGASLDNCLVVDGNRVLSGPLRYRDEFVRHKVLDLVGDIALLGYPLKAEVVAFRAGHALRLHALRTLLARPECFEIGYEGPGSRPEDRPLPAATSRLTMAS
jgi:UDP-3-O-[3-hydroxymyristoyl] N-acetylglucosamine deacetylase